jgi:integrase
MKYLTRDEIQRLLVRIDNKRDKLLVQLGLVLGCRVSEVVNIRLKNVLPDRIILWDEKKNVFREAVVDNDTKMLIDEYLRTEWKPKPHRPHQVFYFSCKSANRIIKRWFAEAGIPKEKGHWHTLRHTYCVQSLESGMPLNYICEQTGDSPATVIKVYGKPSIDARLKMIDEKAYWRAEKSESHDDEH